MEHDGCKGCKYENYTEHIRNKPDTKCIKVLTKNYNEAIQLLKDKGLLYET